MSYCHALSVSFSKSKLLTLLFSLSLFETSPETVNNWKLLPTSVVLTLLQCSSLLNNLFLKVLEGECVDAFYVQKLHVRVHLCSQQSQSCSRSSVSRDTYLVLICFYSSGSGTLTLDYSLHPQLLKNDDFCLYSLRVMSSLVSCVSSKDINIKTQYLYSTWH